MNFGIITDNHIDFIVLIFLINDVLEYQSTNVNLTASSILLKTDYDNSHRNHLNGRNHRVRR